MPDRPDDDLRELDEEPPDKSARRENLDAGVSKDLAFEIGDVHVTIASAPAASAVAAT